MSQRQNPLTRFSRFIEPDPFGGCWLWSGAIITNAGYGSFPMGGKSMAASRAAWLLYRGVIPAGLSVLHKCDVRACCNPDHLFLGTHRDNMADMKAKGRSHRLAGSAHPASRLDEERVAEIRQRLAMGHTQRAVAADCGVTAGTIQAIHEGRTWRSVAAGYHFDGAEDGAAVVAAPAAA